MSRLPDRWLVALDRTVLGVFFRRIEVEGAEHTPEEGPLIVVANHVNGLIDPMLVLGCLPRVSRFLGKSTLWDIPGLRPFLSWARVIPVYRRSDPGVDASRNVETFAASRALLAEGGALAIFPEGKSHDAPHLAPLKTGAARIALEAEVEHALAHDGPGTAAPLGVRILPVGLVFDAKERFRSRVLVEVGEPFSALEAAGWSPGEAAGATEAGRGSGANRVGGAAEAGGVGGASRIGGAAEARGGGGATAPAAPEGAVPPSTAVPGSGPGAAGAGRPRPSDLVPREAVERLTAAVDGALQAVTVNFDSWEEARLVRRAAQIHARSGTAVPEREELAVSAARLRAFSEGYRELRRRHPEAVERTAEAVRLYDRLLATAGLRDRQVASRYALPPVARFLRRSLGTLLVRLPLAVVGTVLNALPYQLASLFGRRVKTLDQKATWKIFPALVAYPATWIGEAAVAGWLTARGWSGLGWGAALPATVAAWLVALLVLVLGPVAGWQALRFHDRRSQLLHEARAFLKLRSRRRFAAELRAEREDIRRRVDELVELHRREAGEAAPPG